METNVKVGDIVKLVYNTNTIYLEIANVIGNGRNPILYGYVLYDLDNEGCHRFRSLQRIITGPYLTYLSIEIMSKDKLFVEML